MEENLSVQTNELAVGYRGKILIRDIALQVKPGEILTLIGPNGAGKSTVLKSIAGQLETLGGTVYLMGREKQALSGRQVAQTLSMVMTGQPVTEYMTARDVVAVGRYPYTGRLGILSEKDWEKVEEALRLVRAQDVAERDFMELSDGQKQRVLLAKALCQEPKVLLLDEPTSFLDIRYKVELLSTIREIVRSKEVAVVMSLHELDLARKVSDKIACVSGNGVDQIGSPDEIFRETAIEKLYEMERGTFEPLFGLAQLARSEGKVQIFVIGGGGSAVDVYYGLQRQGIPFAAGILAANDLEYPIVKALAEEVFVTEAYMGPSEELMTAAEKCIEHCERAICTLTSFGSYNDFNRELLDHAKKCGKLKT